jgi:hypothetical protein
MQVLGTAQGQKWLPSVQLRLAHGATGIAIGNLVVQ